VANVRGVAAFDERSLYHWEVVSFIETEVLWPSRRRLRPGRNDAVQGSGCGFHVVHVGVGD
jgi:hypothetical protein